MTDLPDQGFEPVPELGPRPRELMAAAGRGFAINVVFDVAVQLLVLAQSVIVPRLLGPSAIGLFALAMASVTAATSLKEFGISEKLVQDAEGDSPAVYRVAWSLEMALASIVFCIAIASAPLLAWAYNRPQLIPLLSVLSLTVFTTVLLDLPSAIYLRRLQYARYNVVGFSTTFANAAVTIPLAFAGAGVWSLVAGSVASMLVAAVVLGLLVKMPIRFGWDRAVARRFIGYGWPLWVGGLLGIASTWGGTLTISAALGIAALGYFSLAQTLALRAFRIDGVLAQTLFPALCRIQAVDVERRAFIITNRLTVFWAGPLGFGVAALAPLLVPRVFGPSWRPATFLFQMQGLAVTLGSIGFSWDVFFRSHGVTKPTLIGKVVSESWVFIVLLPAVLLDGLDGAAYAILLLAPLSIAVRQYFLVRIFPGMNVVANASRELLATGLPALFVWLLLRYTWHATTTTDVVEVCALFLGLSAASLLAIDGRFLFGLYKAITRRRASDAG